MVQQWQSLWMIVGPRMVTSETMDRQGIYLAPLDDKDYVQFKNKKTTVPKATMSYENFVVR